MFFEIYVTTEKVYVTDKGTEAASRFYTTNTPETNLHVGFQSGKHEYFPFPQTVMDKNPNLVQNTGW